MFIGRIESRSAQTRRDDDGKVAPLDAQSVEKDSWLGATQTIPALHSADGDSLRDYLTTIRGYPVLSEQEEQHLALRWRDADDSRAGDRLIAAHLRLVPVIARKFKGYGAPLGDLISEGNLGLVQSVRRFDPDKGFRFATYARWWIKAAILNFLIQSWSLVKIGSGAEKKRMFFNLRKAKRELGLIDDRHLSDAEAEKLGKRLGVAADDILVMNQRLSGGDLSLDHPMGDEDGGWTMLDTLSCDRPNQESQLADHQEVQWRRGQLTEALTTLDDRERDILRERYLSGEPTTLGALAGVHGVTAERIRQIETKAIKKLRAYVQRQAEGLAAPFTQGAKQLARAR